MARLLWTRSKDRRRRCYNRPAAMKTTRREFLGATTLGAAAIGCSPAPKADDGVTRFVRFEHAGNTSYGLLVGETIEPFEGDLFGARTPTGESVTLADVSLLCPCKPSKVMALAGNYASHLGEGAELPAQPEPFYKPISSLLDPGGVIVFPPGAQDVHYEAEFVIVIGKKAKNVSEADADDYILGYTCGNDVSECNWQNGSLDGPENKDLQWWRGKGCDTFTPLGPVIATGFDYVQSRIQLRLNGEVKQDDTLDHLIHKPPAVVSFISRYVTLLPGDVIFTGTSGKTSRINPGDQVDVEIDGIGVLQNTVA